MSTLPQTITALESVSGRDHATLTHFGRVIREAGLLPRGKRGGGAPQLTANDLAMLMLGIYFADAPKDAAATARKLHDYRKINQNLRDDLPAVFHRISACETFGDALAATVANLSELTVAFETYIDAAYEGVEANAIAALKAKPMFVIGLNVTVRGAKAEIECTADSKVQWAATYQIDISKWASGEYGFAESDRSVSTTFGLRSILVANECLKGASE